MYKRFKLLGAFVKHYTRSFSESNKGGGFFSFNDEKLDWTRQQPLRVYIFLPFVIDNSYSVFLFSVNLVFVRIRFTKHNLDIYID